MSASRPKSAPGLLLAIALSAAAIFAADFVLPLGIAAWILYFAPIAVSKFAWRPSIPLFTAAGCTILLILGYFVSLGETTEAARYAPINRAFGFVTMWAAAIIGRQFIVSRLAVQRESWFKAAQTGLSQRLVAEEPTLSELGRKVLSFMVEYLNAQVGAIYLSDGTGAFRRFATHALDPSSSAASICLPGEGLVGQAARDKRLIVLRDVPVGYFDIRSGVGKTVPRQLVIAPAQVAGHVQAVIELAFLHELEPAELEVLSRISELVASATRSVNYLARQAELLEETQRQAEELQTQQEELRVQNEELEQQSNALQKSQIQLENQQAELEQINQQLEEQTQSLERQKDDLTRAQGELVRANDYKSEFLANMSHELRTPLNSSLILAKLLLDNREGNLTSEQVNFAQTIYSAGNDLLVLINDILDLSKIEAGKLEVRPESIRLTRMVDELRTSFKPVADERRLDLTTTIDPAAPASVYTDPTRLQQILKNLLSNALKFTEHGGVSLSIDRLNDGQLAFVVKDTGIGIPAEQHAVIFEAFRQADGTTNRKFGGTGLGLSISRDLARLLGGALSLTSAPGRGSTFTLVLPEHYVPQDPAENLAQSVRPVTTSNGRGRPRRVDIPPATLDDDREKLGAGARSILVIEDDPAFARIVRDLAHELDFRVLIAQNAEGGLALAEQYLPSAIVLDVGLPDRSGLSVLDALKHSPTTRHIPVHVVSAFDYTQTALEMGATGYAVKPIRREELLEALRRLEAKFTQKLRRVLIVEDDARHRESTSRLIAGNDVECVAVGTAGEALERLGASTFDCMVLDLTLPDRTGFELLEEMAQKEHYAFPPVIVYTGRSLSREEEQQLRRFSHSIIIKGARSPERLLDEVTLFLHQVESEMPLDQQRLLRDARHRESTFEGRRILVVEDDVRNVFALISVLEPRGAKVDIARNGKEALAHLKDNPGVHLVLMDIMMPEMDGLEATREIRKQPAFAKLPIIALTAKAMADDRESCLAAGANDYIAKPLDVDKLLSLARVWMPK